MKAKLNFTNRETINLNQICLVIDETGGEFPLIEMSLDLNNSDLHSEDKVYLEGTFSGFYQSFDYGKVGNIIPPADNRITDIPADFVDSTSFYVKVVEDNSESGKLRALSRKIIPEIKTVSGKGSAKRSFFRVKQEDLGDTPWKVITDGPSVLVLNSEFQNPKSLLKNNPYFRNILIPAAVKEILLRIVAEAEDFSCEGDEWFVPWNIFVSENLKVSLPEEDDDMRTKLEFVDEVMDIFYTRLKATNKISEAI